MHTPLRRMLAYGCLAGAIALPSTPYATATIHSQESSQLLRQPAPHTVVSQSRAPKDALPEHLKKVNSFLRDTVDRMQGDRTAAAKRDFSSYDSKSLSVRTDGTLGVTIRVSRFGKRDREELERLGLEITFASARDRYIEGWLAYDQVSSVALLDFVTAIRPTFKPYANAGIVTTQGDSILLANQARQTFGVSGLGVKVGVISDSVDGIQQSQSTGDLPSVQVLKFGEGEGEGTAMLEIVHDLAPDAQLAFYGPSSIGDMSSGILALAAAGCDVIVDDLSFFGSPDFEDGLIASSVNQVAASGVTYVTAAGNFAESNFQDDFSGVGSIGGPTRNVHGFPDHNGVQGFVIPGQTTGRVILQWADRFGSASDDYDLYIINSGGSIVATSDDAQDGNDDPIEFAQVTNSSSQSQVFYAIVDLFNGSPRRFNLLLPDISDLQFKSAFGSIGGHQTSVGAITVATINAGDPGNDTIASYSSQGPADSFFPVPVRRFKPDITGIDGVAITGAFGFSNPFFGTSAAAPHIAGIAALMSSYDPNLTPAAVLESLQRSSFDLGSTGFDFVFGSGRANALGAVRGFPRIASAVISGKKLLVAGTHFAPGTTIFVNGLAQKTKRDKRTPTTLLNSKKAAKAIGPGQTVTLVVLNPDGTSSLAYSFTR